MPLDQNPPRSISASMRDWAQKMNATWSPLAGRFITEAERQYWREITERKAARLSLTSALTDDVCPRCDGLGTLNDNGRLVACDAPNCEARKKQERDRYSKLSIAAMIPPIYADLNFAKWQALIDEQPDAMNGKWDAYIVARMFAGAEGKFTLADAAAAFGVDTALSGEPASFASHSVVFTGKNGVGKTSLAVSIAHHLIAEGRAVVYTRLDDFFETLKRTFEKDAEQYEWEVFDLYRKAPVLIIDELTPDRSKPTEWQQEKVHSLINSRHTSDLRTIITTNNSETEFKDLWGDTVESRVKTYHWVKMYGKVLRPRSTGVTSR